MTAYVRASRRRFLTTGAAGAAAMWIPRPVHGSAAAEVRAAVPGVGISKWDLDTPALCVDLDAFERNIAALQARVTRHGVAARPHARTHKTAAIARRQLDAGAIGICTARLSEAEALFAGGIEPICMTTGNLAPGKIRRAMQLRKANRHFVEAVDEEGNARDLSDAARKARARSRLAAAAATRDAMVRAGLNTEIFSGGGTGTCRVDHLTPDRRPHRDDRPALRPCGKPVRSDLRHPHGPRGGGVVRHGPREVAVTP